MRRFAVGAKSRSIRACSGLRPIASPATNAPMIGASLASVAAHANPNVRAKPSTTTVAADRVKRRNCSKHHGTMNAPTSVATTRNPTAAPTVSATSPGPTDPSVTTLTTMVRITRPKTSSATAAPSTILASVVANARRSPNTRAVIPTLVAVKRRPDEERRITRLAEPEPDEPTQRERHRDPDDCHQHRRPGRGRPVRRDPSPSPPEPAAAARRARPAPSPPRCRPTTHPSRDGPMSTPTTISPTTAGTRTRSHASAASFAANRISARSASTGRSYGSAPRADPTHTLVTLPKQTRPSARI